MLTNAQLKTASMRVICVSTPSDRTCAHTIKVNWINFNLDNFFDIGFSYSSQFILLILILEYDLPEY